MNEAAKAGGSVDTEKKTALETKIKELEESAKEEKVRALPCYPSTLWSSLSSFSPRRPSSMSHHVLR